MRGRFDKEKWYTSKLLHYIDMAERLEALTTGNYQKYSSQDA